MGETKQIESETVDYGVYAESYRFDPIGHWVEKSDEWLGNEWPTEEEMRDDANNQR